LGRLLFTFTGLLVCFAAVLCVASARHDTSFVFINQTMSWAAAQSFCRQHHTDLASVRSSSEWEQIQVLVQSAGQNAAWIGLFRNSWSWSDGSNVTFSHWRPTEPNGATDETQINDYDKPKMIYFHFLTVKFKTP
uniref:C-type lectin domain-containing protein n=1 Tax=Poecilia latipinna TaxID=48699 RepID=A0A3B3V4H8_9TELE